MNLSFPASYLQAKLNAELPPPHDMTLDGVSNTVLANALRELEGDGLVHRREYLEVPVRVESAITEPCRQLIPILDALGDWSMAL